MTNLIKTTGPTETLPRIRAQTYVLRSSTVPDADEHIILLDSTRGTPGLTPSASVPDGDPLFTPGSLENEFAEFGVEGTIRVGDQNVTLYQESLTGAAGTSSDWEVESGGTITILAGSTLPFYWDPQSNDFRLRVKAGSTAPSTLVCRLRLVARTE